MGPGYRVWWVDCIYSTELQNGIFSGVSEQTNKGMIIKWTSREIPHEILEESVLDAFDGCRCIIEWYSQRNS